MTIPADLRELQARAAAGRRSVMTIRIMVGHVLDKLRELPAESVHCVVTSPPYYGLRSYGTEPQVWGGDPGCEHEWIDESRGWNNRHAIAVIRGEETKGEISGDANHRDFRLKTNHCRHCNAWRGDLGLEPDLDLYLEHMVEIMREVRRVLRKDGTCWLNLGDAYANDAKWGGSTGGKHVSDLHGNTGIGRQKRNTGFKAKDLMLIPWRLAIRLQESGWWVRSAIVWAKKAPMPESCTDRPTSAWEPVFLLTRSAKYFYDQEAVKEDGSENSHGGTPIEGGAKQAALGQQIGGRMGIPSRRNLRNVWHLGPEPFPESHFAVFPTEIPRICIKAGTSERGVCPKCGVPWCRILHRTTNLTLNAKGSYFDRGKTGARDRGDRTQSGDRFETQTIGWQPSCQCHAGSVPATVLDPFLGAGTTALVANQLHLTQNLAYVLHPFCFFDDAHQ